MSSANMRHARSVDIEALMLLDELGEYQLAQYADLQCEASTGAAA
jgi:hypothetical protein